MARRLLVARPEPRRHDQQGREAEQRWDLAGVGYFMKAWGWMVLTDMHGEIIVKEAIDPTRSAVRLRHAGLRLLGDRAAPRSRDHRSPADRRCRRRRVPRQDGSHLQRRPHEVAEDGVRTAGHRAQPLLEQVDVQASGRHRGGGQVVREQRRTTHCSAIRRIDPGVRRLQLLGLARATTSRTTGRRSSS